MCSIQKFKKIGWSVHCLTFWNNQLYSGDSNDEIRKWNAEGECIGVFKGHTGSVWCLTIWNNHLYSGSCDKTIRKWNSSGECIGVIEGHTSSVWCLTVVKDHLYSGSSDKTIRKWGEYYFKYYKFLPNKTKVDVFNAMLLFKRLKLPKDVQLSIIRKLI